MKYKGDICKVEGCNEPRSEAVKVAMCEAHARSYYKEKNHQSHLRRMQRTRGEATRKRGRPLKQSTAAQSVKFLLVDNVTGEVLRVSGVVEQRVPMADLRSGALHEETEQLFMRKGYAVGERNRAS